jgi:hypothetical protein
MKKTLTLSALVLWAFTADAWTFKPVTWGVNNIVLPDGGVGVALGAGLDGGNIDAGFADGGPVYSNDGGPAADGGGVVYRCWLNDGGAASDGGGALWPCTADGGWQDGGFAYGGASSFTGWSDAFPANTAVDVACYIYTPATNGAANPIVTLIGTPDKNPGGSVLWSAYTDADAGMVCDGGGTCMAPFVETQSVQPYNAVNVFANSADAGLLICVAATL